MLIPAIELHPLKDHILADLKESFSFSTTVRSLFLSSYGPLQMSRCLLLSLPSSAGPYILTVTIRGCTVQNISSISANYLGFKQVRRLQTDTGHHSCILLLEGDHCRAASISEQSKTNDRTPFKISHFCMYISSSSSSSWALLRNKLLLSTNTCTRI